MENNDPVIYLLALWLAADVFPVIAGSLLLIIVINYKLANLQANIASTVVTLCLEQYDKREI
jgi:hypothetical protein